MVVTTYQHITPRGIVKTTQRTHSAPQRYWSQHVTETGNALDLE
jgi:hypothetical protein